MPFIPYTFKNSVWRKSSLCSVEQDEDIHIIQRGTRLTVCGLERQAALSSVKHHELRMHLCQLCLYEAAISNGILFKEH